MVEKEASGLACRSQILVDEKNLRAVVAYLCGAKEMPMHILLHLLPLAHACGLNAEELKSVKVVESKMVVPGLGSVSMNLKRWVS